MVVIGTPGIGKSIWLIYLLILLAKADRCVVLDSVQNKDVQGNRKYLFSKYVLSSPNPLLLCDCLQYEGLGFEWLSCLQLQ